MSERRGTEGICVGVECDRESAAVWEGWYGANRSMMMVRSLFPSPLAMSPEWNGMGRGGKSAENTAFVCEESSRGYPVLRRSSGV